ncbi:MAG: hypothetical protein FJ137_09130 [Deltaproteobacteria bacterium]|nr:hypothetical protein [Deltaproteobacteria bacterium]
MLTAEPVWDEDDASLPDGDVVVSPLPVGPRLTLRFVSAFEPWLAVAGRRINADDGPESRAALLWFGRRQATLWRALGVDHGLRATQAQGQVIVTDVLGLNDGVALDHGAMMGALELAKVRWPAFAVLGASIGSRAELAARARVLYAAGTQLDVRVEEDGRVRARRLLRVGRA